MSNVHPVFAPILKQFGGANHTPGAIRAGKNISDRFRKVLPSLPESNAETLAAIIDSETCAPELLEAARLVEEAWAGNGDMARAVDACLFAIAKVEGR